MIELAGHPMAIDSAAVHGRESHAVPHQSPRVEEADAETARPVTASEETQSARPEHAERVDGRTEKGQADEHVEDHEGRGEGDQDHGHDRLTLSDEAQAVVQQLRERDREVRAHEQAHMAAGAGLVRGGPSYTYQTGPDGHRYAVGGEVSIDTGVVAGDPQATIDKAEQVMRGALAPANPSAQDLSVAASAAQTISQARIELSVQKTQGGEEEGESADAIDQPGESQTEGSGEAGGPESEIRQPGEPPPPVDPARARIGGGDSEEDAAQDPRRQQVVNAYTGFLPGVNGTNTQGRPLDLVA